MKTVLYIDTFSQFGHTNLNKVFLRQFRSLGFKVSVIARSNYINEIEVSEKDIALKIPEYYYNLKAGSLKDRILQWQILRFIKKSIDFRKYDVVFFSYFDEIVFALSGIKGNLFFMNHSNVTGLESGIKRFFLKCISRIGTILVFHESICIRFKEFGISNVVVEPLGLNLPYQIDNQQSQTFLKEIDQRLLKEDIQFKIFIPTLAKYQDDFLKKLFSDISFLEFLEKKRVLIIIKDKSLTINHPNVCLLKSFLMDKVYQAIFLDADFVMLHYPESFKYKVSASLFECFSNNKPCFVSDIEAFRLFESYFNYNPYYSSVAELIMLIQISIDKKHSIILKPYNNLAMLNPTLESIISDKD